MSSEPINNYLDAMWLERGLSENTLAAYRRDLQAADGWLAERSKSLMSATSADLHDFMAERLGPDKVSSRSAAPELNVSNRAA